MDGSVLVIGAGGLGAPGLLQLAHAGIRKFTIIDPDRLELSNLHRRYFTPADIGTPGRMPKDISFAAFPESKSMSR